VGSELFCFVVYECVCVCACIVCVRPRVCVSAYVLVSCLIEGNYTVGEGLYITVYIRFQASWKL
jgi:hypothetical protein